MSNDAQNRATGDASGYAPDGPNPRQSGDPAAPYRINAREWRDLVGWLVFVTIGLVLTAWAVHYGARLGTASAPFLGRYRFQLSPFSLLAPLVAAGVLVLGRSGWFGRARFGWVLVVSYLSALAWALALSLVDGLAGLTRSLLDPDNYRSDLAVVGDAPMHYLHTYVSPTVHHSLAAQAHPPGPVLLLWGLHRIGLGSQLVLGLIITALGMATVPLVLAAVRGVCGHTQGRLYAPVLILAPSAIWVAVSMDAVVAVIGAAMVAAGVRASAGTSRGLKSLGWAALAGLLLGLAALFSYSAGWLGLSVVCLYFARRRPFLNLATGIAALLPILLTDRLGFSWLTGLQTSHRNYQLHVEPYRSVLWWSAISLVALLLVTGPALYPGVRKIRNTAGWPFLVGAACAVLFSVLAGLARGGVENAWLAFFPWLTVAAVAPERQAGPSVPPPLLYSAVGALTAVVVETVLATPW